VVCNRDELRSRRRALPPSDAARSVLMPIDPDGGGTWIAANDAGLVFTLLNVTGRSPRASSSGAVSRRSRGEIVRAIAGEVTHSGALRAVGALDPDDYLPFRLMVWSAVETLEILSDGWQYTYAHGPLLSPMLRASSSLGDWRVIGPRQALFEHLLAQPLTPSTQDAFHRHSWPDRPEISVFMSRGDARTVSITSVDLYPDRVSMTYQDVDAPLSDSHTLRIAAPIAPVAPVAP
jgi:hypothetical protein